MSSWLNGLKTLRGRVGGAMQAVSQQRQFGAQTKEVEIPVKPKRPLTPYFRFLGSVRNEVKKQNPSMKITDIMKIIGQRWERLDENSKKSYSNAYKSEMLSYSQILEKYNKSLTMEQKEAQQQLKLDKQLEKEKREKKKRLRDLGRPKRPASAFFLYVSSIVPPGSKIDEYQAAAKSCSAAWKTMSDAEKAPFVHKFQDDMKSYEKALAKWEAKMIQKGNEELVRASAIKATSPSSKGK